MPEIRELGAQVVGISADSHWSHKAYAEKLGIDFPLLADWFGNVGRLFNVWSEEKQREQRTVFVIDSAGVVTYVRAYDDEELPNIDEAIDVLRRLEKREQNLAS